MEGVGVFHDEFPPPHQAEAGADLIAKLGLDLIQVDWQLAVGADQVRRQGGDDLFVGGSQPLFPALAIGEVEHDAFPRRVAGPTAAALPKVGGLELGQQHFQGACAIHFLAHDLGDLLQDTPEQGQVGIDAGANAACVAGSQQQFVRNNLRLSRIIPQRHQQQAGDAHGQQWRGERTLPLAQ